MVSIKPLPSTMYPYVWSMAPLHRLTDNPILSCLQLTNPVENTNTSVHFLHKPFLPVRTGTILHPGKTHAPHWLIYLHIHFVICYLNYIYTYQISLFPFYLWYDSSCVFWLVRLQWPDLKSAPNPTNNTHVFQSLRRSMLVCSWALRFCVSVYKCNNIIIRSASTPYHMLIPVSTALMPYRIFLGYSYIHITGEVCSSNRPQSTF